MALSETSEHRLFAHEIKFLVGPAVADGIREWARTLLQADPNGSGQAGDTYLTTSLYYDTAAFDVYRRNGSYRRSKYRIRRYCDGDVVFLERKLRTRNLVSKRRSIVAVDEVARLEEDAAERGWPGYWFHRRLIARGLRPVCQVHYVRTARVAMTGTGPIRLTIDQDVRAVPLSEARFESSDDGRNLTAGQCILELKYRYAMPARFKQLVEQFRLTPKTLSKYRLAVQALGLAPDAVPNQGGAALVPVYA